MTQLASHLTRVRYVCLLKRLPIWKICQLLGQPENERYLTEEMFSAVCRLVAFLYGREDFEGSADELRAHLYGHFRGDLCCLPPTEDALRQHVLRAFKQVIISKSAHLSDQNIPDPTEYGRHVTNNRLIPAMMLKSAKPTVVSKSTFCKCKKGKCLRGCSCGNRNIRCTVSCIFTANPDKCGRIARLLAIRETQMKTNKFTIMRLYETHMSLGIHQSDQYALTACRNLRFFSNCTHSARI